MRTLCDGLLCTCQRRERTRARCCLAAASLLPPTLVPEVPCERRIVQLHSVLLASRLPTEPH